MYVEAGTAIMYASIVWTVLPHVPRWCHYLFIDRARRWWYLLRGEVYTQSQMNQLFQGEPFTLSSRCKCLRLAGEIAVLLDTFR